MAASLSYRPQQYEQAYYLGLFRAADVQGRGNIGGADAVKFFGRSKIPVGVLKNIWTVSDTPSTSSLDLKKFAVAVRLIQLTQNSQKGKGQTLETPPGVVLKPVFFEGVSGVSVPMPQAPPQQAGMPPPQPQPTPQQPNRPVPTPSSPPSRALVGMDPYTLSPQERQRYEGLFASYAKTEADGSRFVYGSEAVPLFMKSGVDPNSLREIWNMVDRNPVDNRLDKLEFALAMHLIVCVSKKNLPMPTGGALPNSLLALKAAGASGAPAEPPPSQAQVPPTAPGAGKGDAGPPPVVGSSTMGSMNISDAFEGMSAIGSVTDYSMAPEPEAPPAPALPAYVPDPTVQPTPPVVLEPPTPQPQPTYVQAPQSPKPLVEAPSIPAPVAVAPVPTYEVSDSHLEELNKLKSVLQKLQAENISLKAQLGNMSEEEKHVQQQLGQTVSEITSLSSDLGAKRQEVLDAKNRLLEAKAELKAQKDTKGVLTGLISEAKETADAIESARQTLEGTALAQQSAPPAAEREPENLFDMGYSNPVGGPPPVAENPPMAPTHQGIEGFANEAPPAAGGIVTPVPETQPQQLSIPEPQGDAQYSNYAAPLGAGYPAPAPVPPQQAAGGYPAPAPVPPQQEMGGYPAPATMPPQQEMGGYPAPATMPAQQEMGGYPAPATMPAQQEMGGYPAPATMPPQQQRTPIQHRQTAAPGHVRNTSGFDDSFLMGGSAQALPQDASGDNDNVSHAARSIASNGDYGYDDQAFEVVENMKKKAKKADAAAREAEAAHRKLADEADELRTDADRAQANARSLAAQAAPDEKGKKKGRFGGGGKKKQKKQKDDSVQAAKDANLIKSHFMAIQGQALEAQTIAARLRSTADQLRDEAEAAELDMAAAASKMQRQPAPVAPQQAAGGYSNPAPVPHYGAPPQQQHHQQQQQQQQQPYGMPNGGQQMVPQNGGGYNNYGQPQQQQQQAYGAAPPQMSYPPKPETGNGAAPYGGYGQMAPAPPVAAPGGDPYASPF